MVIFLSSVEESLVVVGRESVNDCAETTLRTAYRSVNERQFCDVVFVYHSFDWLLFYTVNIWVTDLF